MPYHLDQEISKLTETFIHLSTLAEESVDRAIRAVENNDHKMAKDSFLIENKIDQLDTEIEEECLKILALHQPVAVDLRFIITVLKTNVNLERIGDLSSNICDRVLELNDVEDRVIPFDFKAMVSKVRWMLRQSINSLIARDVDLARAVIHEDDAVDKINQQMYSHFKERVLLNPQSVSEMLNYLSICRHLEKIADHAEAIAKEVIYMIEGEIVRHELSRLEEKS